MMSNYLGICSACGKTFRGHLEEVDAPNSLCLECYGKSDLEEHG